MMPESAITMPESVITMPGIADHHAGTGDHDGLELAITFDWNARSQWAGLRKKAEGSRVSAVARVGQAEANLSALETDLKKASIQSPIDGIVLDRQIDP